MNKIRAALYARVSGEQQAAAHTIESQIAALSERAKTDGETVPPERQFLDDGYSGATLIRPAMERLRDLAAVGGIDRVYVHSPDRLARKYAYQVLLIEELRRAGVEIVFLNRPLGQSPEDDLLLQVQGIVSEYERAKIMERSRRGKKHAAQLGSLNVMSNAPYGYRYVTVHDGEGQARFQLVPDQADVVRNIFAWVGRERCTLGEVCRRLQDGGSLTATGKRIWSRQAVWHILQNPVYQGTAAYGKTRMMPRTKKSRLRPPRGRGGEPRRSNSAVSVAESEWVTGVLCGLAPALQMPVLGIATALREGDRQAGASRRHGRLRSILVTAEIALAFVLVVGATLLARSFHALLNEHRGFQTNHRLVFSISYPDSYGQNGVGKEFIDRFLGELSVIPGVVSSGAVNVRPVQGPNYGMGIAAARPPDAGSPPWAGWRVITPGYFRAAGLPLLRGRIFKGTDEPVWAEQGQPPADRTVILSAALAKALFPNEDSIGKHVLLWKGQFGGLDAEVVGVAGDSLERGLDRGPALTVYLPYGRAGLPSEFVLETGGEPMAVVPTARAIIARLDPNLPIADIRTFDDVVSRSVSPQRLNSFILATFSGLALLLASVGMYSVLSYSVTSRAAEIGLRMALGATPSAILRTTVVQALRPALLGIGIGGPGAYLLSGFFKSLLFGVPRFDAVTYAAVAALLFVSATLACWAPARRATQTDPVFALRLE